MFDASVYVKRRHDLAEKVFSGIIILFGNTESPVNYPDNSYKFRQDSNFSYFFGLESPNLIGIIDIEEGKCYLFGDDVDVEDIVWMGPQPTLKVLAETVGVANTMPYNKAGEFIQSVLKEGRPVHYLPPYRKETFIQIKELLGIDEKFAKIRASKELIKAVIELRSIKSDEEVLEIEKAMETAYLMHTTAMKMARPGIVELEIAGTIEGIALKRGWGMSFPAIVTVHGETLHNHYYGNTLKEGNLLIVDAGAETLLHYASDITRPVPVSGKFTLRQRDIYQIVLHAQKTSIEMIRPGLSYRDVHINAAKVIAQGLKDVGLMKGNIDDAVNSGAHALFFPHGLGHMMGLDVHDMEGLGEDYVGYDETVERSKQFGLAYLRFAKQMKPGHVLTVEPGIYFIPALIDKWKTENKNSDFINYNMVEDYRTFGGIRIEDDVLVTSEGYRVLGKPIPKEVEEVEEIAGTGV